MAIEEMLKSILIDNGLVMAALVVALGIAFSSAVSKYVFKNKIPAAAIAIVIALIGACIGGMITGGSKGVTDIDILQGVGIFGGSSLRDFAIISTAYGVNIGEIKRSGIISIVALLVGVIYAYLVGMTIAVAFGYTDIDEIATIASGAVTFVVGPVTGAALGVESHIIAISITVGIVKALLVVLATPLLAKKVKLNNYRSAMVYGGIMGTTVGVTAGLAATDSRLVPYGAMTSTFYTGTGCLLCPTVLYGMTALIF